MTEDEQDWFMRPAARHGFTLTVIPLNIGLDIQQFYLKLSQMRHLVQKFHYRICA